MRYPRLREESGKVGRVRAGHEIISIYSVGCRGRSPEARPARLAVGQLMVRWTRRDGEGADSKHPSVVIT